MYFDTHAHYDDEKFDGIRDGLLQSLFQGDVSHILNCATAPSNYQNTIDLTKRYEGIYGAIGIHPSDTYKYPDIEKELSVIEDIIKSEKKIVALGEIGLDYHYDFSPKDIQKEYFKAQLELSEKLNVPVVIHDRDAHGDVFDMLSRVKVRAVLHSCSESAEQVRQYCKMGHYISFSGSVTFKNARSVKEAALAADEDKLLIETDCPYLSPVPHRGKLNHSGYLTYTCAAIAEIRGKTPEYIRDLTRENAKRFFGI